MKKTFLTSSCFALLLCFSNMSVADETGLGDWITGCCEAADSDAESAWDEFMEWLGLTDTAA